MVSCGSLRGSVRGPLHCTFSPLKKYGFCHNVGILQEGSSVPWPLSPEATCKLLPWSFLYQARAQSFSITLYFERRKGTASPPRHNPELIWCLCLFGLMWLWLPTPGQLVCWTRSPVGFHGFHCDPNVRTFCCFPKPPGSRPGLWQQLSCNLYKTKNNCHHFTYMKTAARNETSDSFQAANIQGSDKNEIQHQMNLTPKPISISTMIYMTNAYFNHSCWATQTKPPNPSAKSCHDRLI